VEGKAAFHLVLRSKCILDTSRISFTFYTNLLAAMNNPFWIESRVMKPLRKFSVHQPRALPVGCNATTFSDATFKLCFIQE
jgi:hypothetical protein